VVHFIVNASQRPPKLFTARPATQPGNQGQRTPEYQPNRENMLEFNNFRMVVVMELVSKSQKSHKSQRFQGFKFSLIVCFDVLG
jgi:hypothetical protein